MIQLLTTDPHSVLIRLAAYIVSLLALIWVAGVIEHSSQNGAKFLLRLLVWPMILLRLADIFIAGYALYARVLMPEVRTVPIIIMAVCSVWLACKLRR